MQSKALSLANSTEEPAIEKKVKYNSYSKSESSFPKLGISLKIADEKIQIKPPEKISGKSQSSSTNVVKLLLSDPSKYNDTYTGIKYKNTVYRVKDNLLIRNDADPENDFVCKMVRVIRPNNIEEYMILAVLEIQWYELSLSVVIIVW